MLLISFIWRPQILSLEEIANIDPLSFCFYPVVKKQDIISDIS